MKKLKYFFLSILTILGFGVAANALAQASSTVILDPPDIASWINDIYLVVQPLFNSVQGWIKIILGVLIIGFILGIVLKRFA